LQKKNPTDFKEKMTPSDKKVSTAEEILVLQKKNATDFKEKTHGKVVSVCGTLHFQPLLVTVHCVGLSLEGSKDFTHDGPCVGVIFFDNDKQRFTPKFLEWVQTARAGDLVTVSGTVNASNLPETPITIGDAKLEGFYPQPGAIQCPFRDGAGGCKRRGQAGREQAWGLHLPAGLSRAGPMR
jgi:hypothetical protein